MRIAFYGLLLANLGLLASSLWLAPQRAATVPAATASAAAGADAPRRIVLASERPPAAAVAPTSAGAGEGGNLGADGSSLVDPSAPADGSALDPAAVAMSAAVDPGAAATAGTVVPAVAGSTAAGVAPAVAGLAQPGAVAAASGAARRCVSLGPFRELDVAAAATVMLKKDGYEPRQRPADGAVPDDYLVVVGGLRSAADQARIVRRLNRGGLDDAFPLPKLEDGYAVSVGVFSQPQRAERRRLAVGRMGIDAKVLERTRAGTVYWLDIDLKPAVPGAPDPAAAWLTPSGPGQTLQVVDCPQPRTVG